MSFRFAVDMPDGSKYSISKLLAPGKSNTKTSKSDNAGTNWLTYSLSLAPAHASGFNLCASASQACIHGCLYTSGYGMVNPRQVLPARIAKARFLRLHKNDFINRLIYEIGLAEKYVRRQKKNLCIRLNVYSDVMWEREYPELFSIFPSVQFYDYTKHYPRMLRYLNGDFPANYHLTFSRSENNESKAIDVLSKGGNVAVPFHVKYFRDKLQPLPKKFLGRPVLDGDLTDLRFLDKRNKNGYIVGLRVKGKAKKDKSSGFVVNPGSII